MPLPIPASDDEVPALWRALGLPGLIDVHTHFMPPRLLAAVWSYFDAQGPLIGRPWPIAYRHNEEERVERLQSLGVRAFSALLYPHKPGMADALNAWAADFAARTPGCLRSATFFPEPEAASYVATALADGARIFKAHVQVGAYDPRDPLLDPVWGQLAEAGAPVVVHCGSAPVPNGATGPGPMNDVLARHPSLVLVIAHLGAPEYGEFLELAEAYPRVHLDTTMCFTRFHSEFAPFPEPLLPRLAGLGDRVLFGSDFPQIPYPYAEQIAALARLEFHEDWLRGVLWGNAARLFGFPAEAGETAGPERVSYGSLPD